MLQVRRLCHYKEQDWCLCSSHTCCVITRGAAALLPDTRAEPEALYCWAAAALRPVNRLGCAVGALVEASDWASLLRAVSGSCIGKALWALTQANSPLECAADWAQAWAH